ncbi:MAG: methyltransferase [Verrucomicrobiota bacterium]
MSKKLLQSPFPPSSDGPLRDIVHSFIHYPTILVADDLNLFGILDEEPLSRPEIAKKLALDGRPTEAMLGMLVSLSLLDCHEGRYYLTPIANTYLLPRSEYYWGPVFEMNRPLLMGAEPLKKAMLENKTGSFQGKLDSEDSLIDEWDAGEPSDEEARGFTECMHALFWGLAQSVAALVDFGSVTRLLDMGGGSGCFSIAIARQNPEMKCTVVDLKPVCNVTKTFIEKLDAEEQVDVQPGDMFSPDWPSGYDGVFFSNVFHDWWEERCRLMARNSFAALPSGGRIFLFEMLLDDSRNGGLSATGFSMYMVYLMRGKQYSAEELRSFLQDEGFVDFTVQSVTDHFSLVSARKP